MSKRFLVTEQEKSQILSMYLTKGILVEQDFTTGDKPEESTPTLFKLGGYYINVTNGNLEVLDVVDEVIDGRRTGKQKYEKMHQEETLSGNILDVDFNLTTGQFTDNKVITITRDQYRSGAAEGNPAILGLILQNVKFGQDLRPNYLGFALALENGIPTIFQIYPIIQTLDKPYEKINNPNVSLNELFIPSKEDYNSTSWVRSSISFRNTGSRTVSTGTNYSDMKYKEFVNNYGIGINAMKGPEGTGVINAPEIKPPMVVSIEIKAEMTDPFKFDKTDLTDNGKLELENFIKEIKNVKTKYDDKIYGEYINFLKSQKAYVTTSSSIDEDPKGIMSDSNSKTTTTLPACRKPGGRPRNEYNKCLSEERAKAIIQELDKSLPELSGTFVANPLGETDRFDKGKKWPEVKDFNQTINNRRLDIKLPKFEKKDIVKTTTD